MSIQKETANQPEPADEAQTGDEGNDAEFEDAWNDLADKEAGQPSTEEGRQADEDADDQDEADKAGQGGNATPNAADAKPASRAETSDDLGDDPAKLREALKAERERAEKAENMARSHGGRLAQTLNELKDLQAKLSTEKKEGATPEGEESTNRKERLKQLAEDYPEVAQPLLEEMAALEERVRKLGEGAQRSEAEATETEVNTFFANELNALTSKHGDFEAAVKSSEYQEWLKNADPVYRRIVAENSPHIVNAAECASVLDRFKADTKWGQTNTAESVERKRRRQLDAGTTVTGRQPAVTHDEEGSFEDEWARLAAKEQRQAATRFR